MTKLVLSTLLLSFSLYSFSYELVVVQGLSSEEQSFVTRNTSNKEHKIIEGKRAVSSPY